MVTEDGLALLHLRRHGDLHLFAAAPRVRQAPMY